MATAAMATAGVLVMAGGALRSLALLNLGYEAQATTTTRQK